MPGRHSLLAVDRDPLIIHQDAGHLDVHQPERMVTIDAGLTLITVGIDSPTLHPDMTTGMPDFAGTEVVDTPLRPMMRLLGHLTHLVIRGLLYRLVAVTILHHAVNVQH